MTTKFSSISIRLAAVAMASLFGLAGTVQAQNAANTTKGKPSQMIYHGGPIITNVNVYYIFYGNWGTPGSPAPSTSILIDLANGLSGSSYYNINSTYFNGAGQHISNSVFLHNPPLFDNYSAGTSLIDAAVQTVVLQALPILGTDPNGVYFVLTSADVSDTVGTAQFCTNYCAYHSSFIGSGQDIKYAFVGNANRCLSACAPQTTSPNGDAGVDAMALHIARELSSAVTDPDGNAWFDRNGVENGDKCLGQFGPTSTAANGSRYNVTLFPPHWDHTAISPAGALVKQRETEPMCAPLSQCSLWP
jgi:hypothetical protein